MHTMSAIQSAKLLFDSLMPFCIFALLWCGVMGLIGFVPRFPEKVRLATAALWPSFLLALSILLMADNVTYSIWGYGIINTVRYVRLAYALFFLFLWGLFTMWVWFRMLKYAGGTSKTGRIIMGLTVLIGVYFLFMWIRGAGGYWRSQENLRVASGEGRRLPNIILFSGDGLTAEHLSAYGYERDTTPFLKHYSETEPVIFCENAYANALNTGSSVASMMTGKWPTTLRLYYPPEILVGVHAYQHLPGILRRLGYYTADISARQFADAYDLNFLQAYHEANGRTDRGIKQWSTFGLNMEAGYFIRTSWQRVEERLFHIFLVKKMQSAYQLVAGRDAAHLSAESDEWRLHRLQTIIESKSARPFFAHVHLLGTHGPEFEPKHHIFSEGQKQEFGGFNFDFYDDAILDFDEALERIVNVLKQQGIWDDTIFVVSSDHGPMGEASRVPLLFHFPHGAHAGRIKNNVSRVDIAPTILSYLNVDIPEWMVGESILDDKQITPLRPIFWAEVDRRAVILVKWVVNQKKIAPPFYSLRDVGLWLGNIGFVLNVKTGALQEIRLDSHTAPLAEADLPTRNAAHQLIIQHLEESGYPIPNYLRNGDSVSD